MLEVNRRLKLLTIQSDTLPALLAYRDLNAIASSSFRKTNRCQTLSMSAQTADVIAIHV